MGRRKRGWNAAAGLSLADLRRLCEEKEAAISKLAARREELATQLAEVDSELTGAGGSSGGGRGGRRRRRRGPGRPPKARRGRRKARGAGKKRGRKPGRRGGRKAKAGARGPRGEGGLQNMIRKALGSSSEPMKLADLAQSVLDAGYKTGSSRFGVIVGQRLSEMKDVKKAGRGLYVLR